MTTSAPIDVDKSETAVLIDFENIRLSWEKMYNCLFSYTDLCWLCELVQKRFRTEIGYVVVFMSDPKECVGKMSDHKLDEVKKMLHYLEEDKKRTHEKSSKKKIAMLKKKKKIVPICNEFNKNSLMSSFPSNTSLSHSYSHAATLRDNFLDRVTSNYAESSVTNQFRSTNNIDIVDLNSESGNSDDPSSVIYQDDKENFLFPAYGHNKSDQFQVNTVGIPYNSKFLVDNDSAPDTSGGSNSNISLLNTREKVLDEFFDSTETRTTSSFLKSPSRFSKIIHSTSSVKEIDLIENDNKGSLSIENSDCEIIDLSDDCPPDNDDGDGEASDNLVSTENDCNSKDSIDEPCVRLGLSACPNCKVNVKIFGYKMLGRRRVQRCCDVAIGNEVTKLCFMSRYNSIFLFSADSDFEETARSCAHAENFGGVIKYAKDIKLLGFSFAFESSIASKARQQFKERKVRRKYLKYSKRKNLPFFDDFKTQSTNGCLPVYFIDYEFPVIKRVLSKSQRTFLKDNIKSITEKHQALPKDKRNSHDIVHQNTNDDKNSDKDVVNTSNNTVSSNPVENLNSRLSNNSSFHDEVKESLNETKVILNNFTNYDQSYSTENLPNNMVYIQKNLPISTDSVQHNSSITSLFGIKSKLNNDNVSNVSEQYVSNDLSKIPYEEAHPQNNYIKECKQINSGNTLYKSNLLCDQYELSCGIDENVNTSLNDNSMFIVPLRIPSNSDISNNIIQYSERYYNQSSGRMNKNKKRYNIPPPWANDMNKYRRKSEPSFTLDIHGNNLSYSDFSIKCGTQPKQLNVTTSHKAAESESLFKQHHLKNDVVFNNTNNLNKFSKEFHTNTNPKYLSSNLISSKDQEYQHVQFNNFLDLSEVIQNNTPFEHSSNNKIPEIRHSYSNYTNTRFGTCYSLDQNKYLSDSDTPQIQSMNNDVFTNNLTSNVTTYVNELEYNQQIQDNTYLSEISSEDCVDDLLVSYPNITDTIKPNIPPLNNVVRPKKCSVPNTHNFNHTHKKKKLVPTVKKDLYLVKKILIN